MKFTIDEFEVEEFHAMDAKQRKRQNEIANKFKDIKLKEQVIQLCASTSKHYIRYVIKLNGNFVGEITFSGENELKPEIGLEIEENFRNKGIGYKLLKNLISRLCEVKNIEYFIYTVRNDNKASIHLVEKLGGVQIRVFKPLQQFDLAFFTYHIPAIKS